MTKEKLKSVEALVKKNLENDKQARNDDDYLYMAVLFEVAEHKGHNLWDFSFPCLQLSIRKLGYPPFETVRRSRQKIQRKFPELRANKEVAEQREDNETTYRQFVQTPWFNDEFAIDVGANDFCSYGERKEGAEK